MQFLSFSILAQVCFVLFFVKGLFWNPVLVYSLLPGKMIKIELRSRNVSRPGDSIIEYIFGFLDYTGISQTQNYM